MIPRGTPIAVVAPSGVHSIERFEQGLEIARDRGHDLRPLPGLLDPHRYLASSDEQRTRQLMAALTDPHYGAVWIARGGYGLTRIIERLDLTAAPRRPVIGFSDITALFNVLWRHGKGPCIHGPVVHSLGLTDDASLDQFFALLEGRGSVMTGTSWISGTATAPIVGGNLCLLAATAGTAAQLDARGKILVLEEVGEPAYKVDRMLQQLRSAGILDGVAGVAVGQLTDCRVPPGADYTTADVVRDHLVSLVVPVIGDLPIGHSARNRGFVWGTLATLEGDTLRLTGTHDLRQTV